MTSVPANLKGIIGKGATKTHLRLQRAEIMERMFLQGTRVYQIARDFEVNPTTVVTILENMGHDTSRVSKVKAKALFRGETPIPPTGHLRALLCQEPAHFVAWLMAETPDGGTLAETLIAIARDTYAEEMDAKKGKVA